ncbi:G2/M phase-specific E3 ubiquitin-protein ligase [Siphateles boraxobius]|uniref:G2/M phase-specific E3 ubiquitin-protein ligase n=1 Tax=Siphateles boraxobius TaxID=180520 RepID=UPI00406430D8
MQEVQHCKIFEGPEESRSLALLGDAVQEGLYRTIGKMISVAVVQGGLPIHFFSERLFSQISAVLPPKFTLEEVADRDIQNQLEKINTAGSVEEARAAISDFADTLRVMGAFTYIKNLEERDRVTQIALNFYLEDRLAQALSQLKEGLMTLGVLDEVVAHPEIFHTVFTESVVPLTSTDMVNLFTPIFSPVGSNRRRSENRTLAFWRDWLLEVEEGNVDNVKLEDILIFASGASKVPLAGFQEKPTITFLEPGLGRSLPTANTCTVSLNLPMCSTFNDFSENMALAIACAKTFGIA